MYVYRLNGSIIGSGANPQVGRSPEAADDNNIDWIAFEAEQNIPHSVSRAQGKAALINAGYWPQVVAYVDSIENATQKALAEVALNDTTTWKRSSSFLAAAAEAINLDEDDIDLLFISASQIEL